jgi:hypothetical protein
MSIKSPREFSGQTATGICWKRSARMAGRGFGSCISDRPNSEGFVGLDFTAESHWIDFSGAG